MVQFPREKSWPGCIPAIQGRECGCTPVKRLGVGTSRAVDKTDEVFVSLPDEPGRYRILDQNAERIEEPEDVDEDDGYRRFESGGRGTVSHCVFQKV
jgi:hypothetical protein